MNREIKYREIKYRAWHKEQKRMLSNIGQISFSVNGEIETIVENNYYTTKDVILMQYTGLKDKNDVEIYEKDIVRTYKGYEWKIKWGNKKAKWYGIGCGKNNSNARQGFSKISKGEVIGNIYEEGDDNND